ncbi:phosphate-starvation-inducible PsiE family protein [Draconibacterium sp.]|nr:phosphate-starvation-inducible PsiE family protein [Draconibacterium sp.]
MDRFNKVLKAFERMIILILVSLMGIVLMLSAVEVGIIIINQLANPFESNGIVIDINGLMEIFGFFLIVLIGFELYETVKLYLKENVFHGEVILVVSLIAVARKVIILDYTEENPMSIIAIAALIAAISLGYYLLKKTYRNK